MRAVKLVNLDPTFKVSENQMKIQVFTPLHVIVLALAMVSSGSVCAADSPGAVLKLKIEADDELMDIAESFSADIEDALMDSLNLDLLARGEDLQDLLDERGMSGSQIVVGDDYEGLGSLGEVGADMLVDIKITLRTQKRVMKTELEELAKEKVRATASWKLLSVKDGRRVESGSKRLASDEVVYDHQYEFPPTEDMVEDALLKVVDAIANEGTNKIEQWWSKVSAAKEAEQLLSKIDEVAPYRSGPPLGGAGVLLSTSPPESGGWTDMLLNLLDRDSSQTQAIERSYRSSLKRELVKRGIQVVDEGFTEQRRDGKKPVGLTKVTDLELARSLGAAAVCYATVEAIEVEQKSGAKRFSIRASWSLVRASDGFSVAAGDGAAAFIERGDYTSSSEAAAVVSRVLGPLCKQLARKLDYACVDFETLTKSLRPGEIEVPIKISSDGLTFPMYQKIGEKVIFSTRKMPIRIDDAVVQVDGRVLGNAASNSIGIEPGLREISVVRTGFGSWTQEIMVQKGSDIRVNLQPTDEMYRDYMSKLKELERFEFEKQRAEIQLQYERREAESEAEYRARLRKADADFAEQQIPIRLELEKQLASVQAEIQMLQAKSRLAREEAAAEDARAGRLDAQASLSRARERNDIRLQDCAMILQLQQQAAILNSMHASTALPSESALIKEVEEIGDMLVETIDSGVDQLIQWFESQNFSVDISSGN